MGEVIGPAGVGKGPRCLEPTSHQGDAVLYCLEGPIIVNFPQCEECFLAETDESVFVPQGDVYQFVNLEAHPIRAVFSAAPTF